MKHSKIFIFFLFILFLSQVFISCSKDNISADNSIVPINQRVIDNNKSIAVQNNNTIYNDFKESEYNVQSYLDNLPVEGITYNLDTDNWILILMKLDDNNNELVEVRKFTKKEDYMKYGDDNRIPLRQEIEMKEELNKYVIEHDIIQYYNKNGDVPASYRDYEESLYDKYFGRKAKQVQSRNLWIQLYKQCKGGSSIPMFHAYAFMPWGWNNKVSAHEVVGLFAGLAVYDKTFFRKHLVTLWNTGLYKMCWEGFTFNNRMSSGIKVL